MAPRRKCECMAASCGTCSSREYARKVYRLETYGQWDPKGDIEAVRDHLDYLGSHRIGLRRISDLTGLSKSTVFRIRSGQSGWVTKSVANAILAIQPDSTLRINPIGTSRRIRALMALGYTTYYIAGRIGVRQSRIWDLSKARSWVSPTTHRAFAELYEELCMTPGPSSTTRARSLRAGHAPPLAWDDIDDPDETPADAAYEPPMKYPGVRATEYDEVIVERVLAGDRTVVSNRAEKDEAMRRWLSMGNSEQSLCAKHSWRGGRYGKAS